MKKQNEKQSKKLSLSKVTIAHLNSLQLSEIVGGHGGAQTQTQTATTISNVSFSHTAPSGVCV